MVQTSFHNRREYFRLSFAELSGTMQINEIGGRPITTTPKAVRIVDAGGGGLGVALDEDFPIRRNVIALFEFGVGHFSFSFRGVLVRKIDDRATYQYGVRFVDVDEKQRGLLVSALGRLQVERNSKAGSE